MKQQPSPNFNDRARELGIHYVVIHYTGMQSAQAALERMCDPQTKVSAHYMIDEDGRALQLVDEGKRAWHAGVSYWKGESDLNSLSIGIELVNPGHEFGYHPFPKAQIDSLKILLHDLYKRHQFTPASLLAHSDIAPARRLDPGELFPWQELAAEGFGVWPEVGAALHSTMLANNDINDLLRRIGYDCPADDTAKAQTAQTAFLRRYHPTQLDIGFTPETCARLTRLVTLL